MMNNEKEKDAIDASKLDEILPKYEPLKLNGINLAQNYVSAFNTGMNIYQCVNQLQGYIEWVVKAVNDVVKLWNVQVGDSIDQSKAIVRETTTEQFNTEWNKKQPELITQVNTLTTNQFNNEKSIFNDELNALNARMDTFTRLSEGSTTGDAELKDIRVGANGITYNNAGDSVRGQYSKLKEDLVYQLENGIIKVNSTYRHVGDVSSGSNLFFEYNFDNTKKYLLNIRCSNPVSGVVYFTAKTSSGSIVDENIAYITPTETNMMFEYEPVESSNKVYFWTQSTTKDIIFDIYEYESLYKDLNARIDSAEKGSLILSEKEVFKKKIGKGLNKLCDIFLKKGTTYRITVNRSFSVNGIVNLNSKYNGVIVDEDFIITNSNGSFEYMYTPINDVDSFYYYSEINKCNIIVEVVECDNVNLAIEDLEKGIIDKNFMKASNISRSGITLDKLFDCDISGYTCYKIVFDIYSINEDSVISIDTRDSDNKKVEQSIVSGNITEGRNTFTFKAKKNASSIYVYSNGVFSGKVYLYNFLDINDIKYTVNRVYELSNKSIEPEGYLITCFPSNDEANKIDLKLSYDGVSTIHVGTIYEGKGFLCRDPDIFKIGKYYYCTFTGTSIKIIRSKDLINWEDYKDFTPNFDEFEINPDSFWAPEFFRDNDGSLYLSFTAHQKTTSDSKGFITQSFVLKFDDDTLNSYSGLQRITYPDIDPNYSFDSTFYNDNGTYYMCSHGTNANIYTSNSVYGEFTKKAKIPSSNYAEGFTILKNGDYFFFYCDEKQDGTENSMCLILYKTKDFLNWERYNLGSRTRHCKLLPMSGLDRAIGERAYMKLNFSD